MKDLSYLNHKDYQDYVHPSQVPIAPMIALESNMGRLDKLEFEDVFNRDNKIMKMNAHDVYISQFQ